MKLVSPLRPHFSLDFWTLNSSSLFFLNSGRAAFRVIVRYLKSRKNIVFLLPAFTCPSMIEALEAEKADYNFADIDNSLLFEEEDLQKIIHKYSEENCAIVATSLFGTKLPNYKGLFPNAIIIEDRAQSQIEEGSDADYQFTSFGKGKLVSGFGGGAIKTQEQGLIFKYNKFSIRNGFLLSYIMTVLQDIVLKYFWFIIEILPLDLEKTERYQPKNREIFKLSGLKVRWIINSLKTLNTAHRRKISDYYFYNINKEYLFDIGKNTPYLRMPVKKVIEIKGMGISKMKDYRYTYQKAIQKRGIELPGSKRLAFESSFLPTHDLVTLEQAKKIIDAVNY